MLLNKVHISHFRNLRDVHLMLPNNGYCLISGPNGSGKTSILEAIYALSCGKSFRTTDSSQLIQNNQENFTLFATLRNNVQTTNSVVANVEANGVFPAENLSHSQPGLVSQTSARDLLQDPTMLSSLNLNIGIQRDRNGKTFAKYMGEPTKFSEIARLFPVRVMSPIESYTLINGGPEQRRRFLDWGMFHVKHSYWNELQKCHRILKQKSAALKMRCSDNELKEWNNMLAEISYSLDKMRCEYMSHLNEIFNKYREKLPILAEIKLEYLPGWSRQSTDLYTQLSTISKQERLQGHCLLGPHRAEILLQTPHGLCKEQLSRGRQKTLAIALYISQGEFLFRETGRYPLYMIDDFSSELDNDAQQLLIEALDPSDKQILITTLDDDKHFIFQGANVIRYSILNGNIAENASI